MSADDRVAITQGHKCPTWQAACQRSSHARMPWDLHPCIQVRSKQIRGQQLEHEYRYGAVKILYLGDRMGAELDARREVCLDWL